MSTRSSVGIPTHGGDSWKGRYVHSDGYPSGMGPVLRALVQRDGWERVGEVICVEHAGWSNLNPSQPDITGVKLPKLKKGEHHRFDYGTAEYVAYTFSPNGGHGDGRFDNVPDYGISYNIASGQVDEEDWITPDNCGGYDVAWLYVIGPTGLFVATPQLTHQELFRWSDPEPDWQAYEDSTEVLV